jgi:threonine dehydrogenase-like Zn-dependent dehydrogenase
LTARIETQNPGGSGRVLAVDRITSRLEMARTLGAEVINFDDEDPVEVIHELTGGIGVDRTIDAVGVDAMQPEKGPALKKSRKLDSQFRKEVDQVAPRINPHGKNWIPGNGPSQALLWQTEAIAKAGTMSVIGVYPQTFQSFPFGMIMNKNLTIKAGNCNHRKYIPMLLEMVQGGVVSPKSIITQVGNLDSIIKAYKAFDERQPGWLKVEILASEEHDMKRQKHLEEVTAQNGKSFVHNF